MTHIQTVTGLFPVEKLERVLMHEHIVLGYAGWFYDPAYAHFDHDRAERQTLTRLQQLRDLGVNLVVDPCPMELGRNPDFMQEMSVKSGVQIMCSTGFDLQARGNCLLSEPRLLKKFGTYILPKSKMELVPRILNLALSK